jgi:hypothetical protein
MDKGLRIDRTINLCGNETMILAYGNLSRTHVGVTQ